MPDDKPGSGATRAPAEGPGGPAPTPSGPAPAAAAPAPSAAPSAEAPAEPEPPPPLPDWIRAILDATAGVHAVYGAPGGAGPSDVPTLECAPESWADVAAAAAAQGFTAFVDLGGVDRPERASRFEVVLYLRDHVRGLLLRCRTAVPEGGRLPSIEPEFPGAGWPEREVFDLLGVPFDGNADLRRLLLPEQWDGHPLRRDYPLQGPRALDPESPFAL